jgi:5-methylcytosine-specific restriction endonuclease McrA
MATRKKGQGSKWIRQSTRCAIYHRDDFSCAYCGTHEDDGAYLTLDHILACENGGDNKPSNLVTSCRSCNSAKQDLSTRGWFAYLHDRGIDTNKVGRKVRRLSAKSLDRAAGRAIATTRYAKAA